MPNRNAHQCRQKWVLSLDPGLKRGGFRPWEDIILYKYVFQDVEANWTAIAKQIPGRTCKQCRERAYYLKKNYEPNSGMSVLHQWEYSFSIFSMFVSTKYSFLSIINSKYSTPITWLDNSDCFNVNNGFKSNMQLQLLLVFILVTVLARVQSVAIVQSNVSSDDSLNGKRRLLEECYGWLLIISIRYSWSCVVYSGWWTTVWVILSPG